MQIDQNFLNQFLLPHVWYTSQIFVHRDNSGYFIFNYEGSPKKVGFLGNDGKFTPEHQSQQIQQTLQTQPRFSEDYISYNTVKSQLEGLAYQIGNGTEKVLQFLSQIPALLSGLFSWFGNTTSLNSARIGTEQVRRKWQNENISPEEKRLLEIQPQTFLESRFRDQLRENPNDQNIIAGYKLELAKRDRAVGKSRLDEMLENQFGFVNIPPRTETLGNDPFAEVLQDPQVIESRERARQTARSGFDPFVRTERDIELEKIYRQVQPSLIEARRTKENEQRGVWGYDSLFEDPVFLSGYMGGTVYGAEEISSEQGYGYQQTQEGIDLGGGWREYQSPDGQTVIAQNYHRGGGAIRQTFRGGNVTITGGSGKVVAVNYVGP